MQQPSSPEQVDDEVGTTMDRSEPHRGSTEDEGTVPAQSTLRREGAFVILTFVGMIGGLLAVWFGGPSWLVWTCYTGAYVFGGIFLSYYWNVATGAMIIIVAIALYIWSVLGKPIW